MGLGKENHFVEVSPEDARVLLQAGIPTRGRLLAWTEGQKHSFQSRIQDVQVAAGAFVIAVPKELTGNAFESSVRQSGIDEILFSLNLPTDVLFFKGELRPSNDSILNFRVKNPVYKVQRRRNLRLPLTSDRASKAKIQLSAADSQPILAEILNVSEGGIGILVVDETDQKRLPAGKKLEVIEFTIDRFVYRASGEVKHVQEIPVKGPTGGRKKLKVGIQFTKIDPAASTRLANFVFEESSKFFGRI